MEVSLEGFVGRDGGRERLAAKMGIVGRSGTRTDERCADRPEEDSEDGACSLAT